MAQATFVETSKGRRSIVHEGYIYQKIRENGERSWWRCKDRTCKGKLRLENGQVTATTGEHFHPPSQAQTSANIVISSMKRKAREESVPLPQIYRQEMTKLYGGPGCDEIAVNVPSFQNLKSSLYRSRLQRFPTLPQTREEIDFSGEWTRTAREEDFLLVDTGHTDRNRLVAFATVGNLEKLCEAETIYIDGTFNSGELRHGTCHFHTMYTGISKIHSVYGNLKHQMKLDLCICEALSYTSVPWKPYLWAWLSITTNIN